MGKMKSTTQRLSLGFLRFSHRGPLLDMLFSACPILRRDPPPPSPASMLHVATLCAYRHPPRTRVSILALKRDKDTLVTKTHTPVSVTNTRKDEIFFIFFYLH
jgi:hypothetical protein